ncbi:hypothetical protein EX30DRAFT_392094 [Ascodesmis nigricans]|uniref:MARVEL domain-containing protein n=1 Tax=Ascodesmis nigricans TaxID=341454 RepID=A0A4S2N5U3_9PEZI|nr:hypothetical protein EX30DRAFT_392094 [Ascodesmis nigricans]
MEPEYEGKKDNRYHGRAGALLAMYGIIIVLEIVLVGLAVGVFLDTGESCREEVLAPGRKRSILIAFITIPCILVAWALLDLVLYFTGKPRYTYVIIINLIFALTWVFLLIASIVSVREWFTRRFRDRPTDSRYCTVVIPKLWIVFSVLLIFPYLALILIAYLSRKHAHTHTTVCYNRTEVVQCEASTNGTIRCTKYRFTQECTCCRPAHTQPHWHKKSRMSVTWPKRGRKNKKEVEVVVRREVQHPPGTLFITG